ncbi:MAG: thioredoxin family protein [Candidatus Thorarchaeota archaeon SMTZ1-83]
MVKEVDIDGVEYEVKQSKVTLIDCWAPWCKPCKDLAPILENLEMSYSDNPDVSFLKIDVQEHHEYGRKHDIMAIPCVLVFFEGEPALFEDPSGRMGEKKTDRLIGLRPAEHYESVISHLLQT